MIVRWLLAALHLVALGIGIGAVWTRASAFRSVPDEIGFRRLLAADAVWGVAAVIWIATGLLRAFGGLEKGSAYYLNSTAFWTKMALLGVILGLEVWPMATLIRWRLQRARNEIPDTRQAFLFARISHVQAVLLVVMVFVATAIARGLGQ